MKRLRIYARLSLTKGDDVSIHRQLDFGHSYLKERQATRADVVHDCKTDDYVESVGTRSGGSEDRRPRYRQLLTDIEHERSDGVLWAYDLARLTRADDLMVLLRNLRKWKQEIVTYRDEIDLDSLTGRTSIRLKQFLNAYYRDDISDRIKSYYAGARKEGWVYHRRAPLGLLLEGSKASRKFITDPVTFPLVLEFCRLIADSHSIRESAKILVSRGFQARTWNGASRPLDYWHLNHIARSFEMYRPFLPKNLYNQCVRRFAELSSKAFHGMKSKTATGILSHILVCSSCKKRWGHTVEKPHANLPNYLWRSYRHTGTSLCPNGRRVAAPKLEAQIWSALDPFFDNLARKGFAELVFQSDTPQPTRDIRRELERLESNFRAALSSASFSPSVAEQFNLERERLQAELQIKPKPSLSRDEIKDLVASAPAYHELAETNPARFNIILRDIFERVEIDQQNHLAFIPRAEFRCLIDAS